jgi:peptidyl-prolyl cis-trans isomerase C
MGGGAVTRAMLIFHCRPCRSKGLKSMIHLCQRSTFKFVAAAALAGLVASMGTSTGAMAQEKVVAKVNDKVITEADLKLADAEIGSELGNLPDATKRRVLIEFLIENQLFADAAEGQKLGTGKAYDERLQYWKRRALRDTYFDASIKDGVGEAEAKKLYEAQVAQIKPEEEVKARHILVKSEDKAKEIAIKIASGDDKLFAEQAKAHSEDPGTKDEGGDLGFFGRGQMVPQFEEAAFKLKKGEISAPVQSQFGWHLIKVDDKRTKQPPEFAAVKERILASMVHRKAQELATDMRSKAKLEYIDPAVKAMVDAEAVEKAKGAEPKKQ